VAFVRREYKNKLMKIEVKLILHDQSIVALGPGSPKRGTKRTKGKDYFSLLYVPSSFGRWWRFWLLKSRDYSLFMPVRCNEWMPIAHTATWRCKCIKPLCMAQGDPSGDK